MNNGSLETESASTTNPKELFKPGSWLIKIDFINHLVLFNNVLIAVLSEKAGGKTSFNSLLQNNLDQRIRAVSICARSICSRAEVIQAIAQNLNIQIDSESSMASLAAQINESKAHVLVSIDDAHHLPEAVIEELMLVLKNQGDMGYFHVCFIADSALIATLNHLAATHFKNLTHVIELGSLSESETRTYIVQRAMKAGWINKPFNELQFRQFYQLTKGQLAKINSSLESFITDYNAKKLHARKKLIRRSGFSAGAALILAVFYVNFSGIYHVYQYPDKDMDFTVNHTDNDLINNKNQVAQLESYIAPWHQNATLVLLEESTPKIQLTEELIEENALSNLALVDKVVVIPSIRSVKKELLAQQSIDQTVAVLESSMVQVPKMNFQKDNQQILMKKSKDKGYTIQLIASHRVTDIHRFRKTNQLVANTKVRHFTNSKGSWYILTLGEFNNRNSAQSQTNELPQHLAKLKPWVRSVNGLSELG